MTYEVDIRLMLGTLGRRWKTVTVSSLAVVAVTLATSFLVPRSYRASVLLNAPLRRTYFGDQITKSSYVGVALNDELAVVVYQALDGQLRTEVGEPEDLLDYVRVQSGQGDAFSIQAVMPDREDAVLLANTWAEQLVAHAKEFYGTGDALDRLAEIRGEVVEEVEAADAELMNFRASTGIDLIDGGYGTFPEQTAVMSGGERFGVLGMRWRAEGALLADYQVALDHLRFVREAAVLALANPDTEALLPLELLRVPILEQDPDLEPEALASQDLQALVNLLGEKEGALAAAAEQVQTRVEELQHQLEDQGLQLERLLWKRWEAQDTHKLIREKEWDLRVWQEAYGCSLHIVAPARKAREAMLVGLEAKLIIAAVIGAVLGSLISWWQEFGQKAVEDSPDSTTDEGDA